MLYVLIYLALHLSSRSDNIGSFIVAFGMLIEKERVLKGTGTGDIPWW